MHVFKETQKFDQWLIKLIYLGIIGFLAYTLYTLYIKKEDLGNVGVNDSSAQLILISTILLVLGLFYIFKLNTSIDEIGIHYQFLPIHFSRKTVRWENMKKCYVRKYNPIMEYGGWGYRFSFGSGKAFNVRGNKGIQVELMTGKKILIGTQKAKDVQQIINRYIKKNERI